MIDRDCRSQAPIHGRVGDGIGTKPTIASAELAAMGVGQQGVGGREVREIVQGGHGADVGDDLRGGRTPPGTGVVPRRIRKSQIMERKPQSDHTAPI
jgi:hypothetical protein